MIAEQSFHIHKSLLGCLLGSVQPSPCSFHQPRGEPFHQLIPLVIQQGQNFLLNQLAYGFTAQVVIGCLVKSPLNELLDE